MALPVLPPVFASWAEAARRLATQVNALADGRSNATGTVTLSVSSATTMVNDRRVGGDSVIVFMPITANAASALATLHVASRAKGTFTLIHASNEQADRTFAYQIQG